MKKKSILFIACLVVAIVSIILVISSQNTASLDELEPVTQTRAIVAPDDDPHPNLPEIVPDDTKPNAQPDQPINIVIYGTVTDSTTLAPIKDAVIQLIANNDIIAETKSKKNGSYKLPTILTDDAQIKAVAKGFHEDYNAVKLSSHAKQEYNIALTPVDGLSIVLNNITEREPILSTVTVKEIETEKVVYHEELQNGTYKLNELDGGPYLVTAVSHDQLTEVRQRAMGGSEVYLTLKPFARLNVEFTNKKDDAPTNGVYRYTYTFEDGETQTTDWTNFTSGAFFIDQLMPGNYQIEARTEVARFDQGHTSKSPLIHLEMGETRYVKLSLTSGGTIRGHLTMPPELQGKPGKVMVIKLHNMGEDKEEGETSSFSMVGTNYDVNGDFVVDELPSGNFMVAFESMDGDVSAFSNISVGSEEDMSLDFDISASRKEASNGNSLRIPTPHKINGEDYSDDRFAALPDDEKLKYAMEMSENLKRWHESLNEQAEYQKNVFKQRALDDENDEIEDDFE